MEAFPLFYSPSVVLVLAQSLRRWPNIKSTLGQHLVTTFHKVSRGGGGGDSVLNKIFAELAYHTEIKLKFSLSVERLSPRDTVYRSVFSANMNVFQCAISHKT